MKEICVTFIDTTTETEVEENISEKFTADQIIKALSAEALISPSTTGTNMCLRYLNHKHIFAESQTLLDMGVKNNNIIYIAHIFQD